MRIFLVLLFIFVLKGEVLAEGETGLRILVSNLSAEAGGMGEVFSSFYGGLDSIYYNPAGVKSKEKQIVTMLMKGQVDIYYGFLGYIHPIKRSCIGIGIVNLQGGEVELNYPDRPSEVKKAQTDYVLNLVYSLNLGKVDTGINLKLFQSTLMEEVKAEGFALDLGLIYQIKKFSLGIAAQNIGPDVSYEGGLASGEEKDSLPLVIRGGASYRIREDLRGAIDIVKIKEEEVKTHLGLEYRHGERLTFRLGYKFGYDLSPITAGFGIKIKNYRIDYAIALMGGLDSTHQLTLGVRF